MKIVVLNQNHEVLCKVTINNDKYQCQFIGVVDIRMKIFLS